MSQQYWIRYTVPRHRREEWHFCRRDRRYLGGWKLIGRIKLFKQRWYGHVYPGKSQEFTAYEGRSMREAFTRVEAWYEP